MPLHRSTTDRGPWKRSQDNQFLDPSPQHYHFPDTPTNKLSKSTNTLNTIYKNTLRETENRQEKQEIRFNKPNNRHSIIGYVSNKTRSPPQITSEESTRVAEKHERAKLNRHSYAFEEDKFLNTEAMQNRNDSLVAQDHETKPHNYPSHEVTDAVHPRLSQNKKSPRKVKRIISREKLPPPPPPPRSSSLSSNDSFVLENVNKKKFPSKRSSSLGSKEKSQKHKVMSNNNPPIMNSSSSSSKIISTEKVISRSYSDVQTKPIENPKLSDSPDTQTEPIRMRAKKLFQENKIKRHSFLMDQLQDPLKTCSDKIKDLDELSQGNKRWTVDTSVIERDRRSLFNVFSSDGIVRDRKTLNGYRHSGLYSGSISSHYDNPGRSSYSENTIHAKSSLSSIDDNTSETDKTNVSNLHGTYIQQRGSINAQEDLPFPKTEVKITEMKINEGSILALDNESGIIENQISDILNDQVNQHKISTTLDLEDGQENRKTIMCSNLTLNSPHEGWKSIQQITSSGMTNDFVGEKRLKPLTTPWQEDNTMDSKITCLTNNIGNLVQRKVPILSHRENKEKIKQSNNRQSHEYSNLQKGPGNFKEHKNVAVDIRQTNGNESFDKPSASNRLISYEPINDNNGGNFQQEKGEIFSDEESEDIVISDDVKNEVLQKGIKTSEEIFMDRSEYIGLHTEVITSEEGSSFKDGMNNPKYQYIHKDESNDSNKSTEEENERKTKSSSESEAKENVIHIKSDKIYHHLNENKENSFEKKDKLYKLKQNHLSGYLSSEDDSVFETEDNDEQFYNQIKQIASTSEDNESPNFINSDKKFKGRLKRHSFGHMDAVETSNGSSKTEFRGEKRTLGLVYGKESSDDENDTNCSLKKTSKDSKYLLSQEAIYSNDQPIHKDYKINQLVNSVNSKLRSMVFTTKERTDVLPINVTNLPIDGIVNITKSMSEGITNKKIENYMSELEIKVEDQFSKEHQTKEKYMQTSILNPLTHLIEESEHENKTESAINVVNSLQNNLRSMIFTKKDMAERESIDYYLSLQYNNNADMIQINPVTLANRKTKNSSNQEHDNLTSSTMIEPKPAEIEQIQANTSKPVIKENVITNTNVLVKQESEEYILAMGPTPPPSESKINPAPENIMISTETKHIQMVRDIQTLVDENKDSDNDDSNKDLPGTPLLSQIKFIKEFVSSAVKEGDSLSDSWSLKPVKLNFNEDLPTNQTQGQDVFRAEVVLIEEVSDIETDMEDNPEDKFEKQTINPEQRKKLEKTNSVQPYQEQTTIKKDTKEVVEEPNRRLSVNVPRNRKYSPTYIQLL